VVQSSNRRLQLLCVGPSTGQRRQPSQFARPGAPFVHQEGDVEPPRVKLPTENGLPRRGTSKQPEDRLEERIPALIVHWPPNDMQRERQCRLRLFRVPIPKHYEQVVELRATLRTPSQTPRLVIYGLRRCLSLRSSAGSLDGERSKRLGPSRFSSEVSCEVADHF
jgi:hypothetical protein